MTTRLTRRTLLKSMIGGASVAMGLPLLERMLTTNGDALASGGEVPRIFGLWFCGNGLTDNCIVPPTTGTDWRLQTTDELEANMQLFEPEHLWDNARPYYVFEPEDHPLHRLSQPGLRDKYSFVTGTKIAGSSWAQHLSAQAQVFRGCRARGTQASADQVMADLLGTQSLVMSFNRGAATTSLSHRKTDSGGSYTVTPYVDPYVAFQDLFGATLNSEANLSVIDYILPQLNDLDRRVSAADRQRLDQHFTAIREVEAELQDARLGCTPEAPLPFDAQDIQAGNLAFAKILASALACGVRRSFLMSAMDSQSQIAIAGVGVGQHSLQHRGFLGDKLQTLEIIQTRIAEQSASGRNQRLNMLLLNRRAVSYELGLLADLIETFDNTPYGAGSLLDASGIVGMFEMWSGNYHGYQEHPLWVIGNAQGRLKQGHHIRDLTTGKPQDVVQTVMRAVADNPDDVPNLGDGTSTIYGASVGFSPIEV